VIETIEKKKKVRQDFLTEVNGFIDKQNKLLCALRDELHKHEDLKE